MICTVIALIIILIFLSFVFRREWLSIFTALFIFSFFIILGLISIVPLISQPENDIFLKENYIKCYGQYKICGQQVWNEIQAIIK